MGLQSVNDAVFIIVHDLFTLCYIKSYRALKETWKILFVCNHHVNLDSHVFRKESNVYSIVILSVKLTIKNAKMTYLCKTVRSIASIVIINFLRISLNFNIAAGLFCLNREVWTSGLYFPKTIIYVSKCESNLVLHPLLFLLWMLRSWIFGRQPCKALISMKITLFTSWK